MTEEIPLGRATAYPEQYSPGLLYAIARTDSRSTLGLTEALPFHGCDIWNAWELTWLNPDGLPQVVTAEIRVPADSPNIIESKSLKLYLNSFAMTAYASSSDVCETIEQDLISCTDSEVSVQLIPPSATDGASTAKLPGDSLDTAGVRCTVYDVDAGLLQADSSDIVTEQLHSHLLRSLCPVTSQSDSGSVMIAYRGPRIDRAGLLRYIVSYRRHNDYHESCVERMFIDILEHCNPEQLSVFARYQRRGGIDINPFRSNFEHDPPNARVWRQ
jgi:7-cyano-7-deazaguanine reductase